MTPEELAAAIRTVLEEASAEGSLALPAAEIPDPRVERPRNRDHGDWSTNVAMQLAKKAGTKPRDLAELLVPRLEALNGIASVEVAGPGFLNIRLDAASAGELARSIVEAGEAYGRNDSLSGQHINLEYVSANPTGPVHLGAPAGPPSVTPWPESCPPAAPRSPGSTTSTTTAPRSTASPAPCWPPHAASRPPRTATAAPTSVRSPSR